MDQPWGRRRRDGTARKVSWRAAGFGPPPCEGIAAMPRWRWRRSEVGGAGQIQSGGSLTVDEGRWSGSGFCSDWRMWLLLDGDVGGGLVRALSAVRVVLDHGYAASADLLRWRRCEASETMLPGTSSEWRCATLRMKILPGFGRPASMAPAGVVPLSGGDVECVAISLVLGVGSCLRAKALLLWSGMMAASATSFLCWEHRARRLSFLLALLRCSSWP